MLFFLWSCSSDKVVRPGTSYSPYQGQADFAGAIKKRVTLLPLYNESPYGKEDLAVTATAELRKELTRMRDFAIDQESTKLFGDSKAIYSGGGLKLAQLARKAKQAGINLVIYGRIVEARVRQKTDEIGIIRKTKSYAETIVELRIFDVHANKEIFQERLDGNINDASHRFFLSKKNATSVYKRNLLRYSVRVAIRRFLPKINRIAAKLDWVGRVAKIIGGKIYINAGRRSGLSVGDVLKVMTEGSEIIDPETGNLIGVSKGEVKGTLEVIDYFGPDGAVSVLNSGGTVTEGDYVKLY